MLEYIKQDRSLSFNNWRYRLLHWTLGVNPVDQCDAENKGVPGMFYTHYCPLFHFTNLVAIFLPFVILLKITHFVVKQAINLRNKYKSYKSYKSVEDFIAEEHKTLLQYMKKYPDNDFQETWYLLKYDIAYSKLYISEEEAREFYNKYSENIKKHAALRAEKTKLRRNNIVFWVNFSQIFVKGILNFIYVGLIAFMAWLLWSSRHTIISLIYGLWTFDVLAALLWMTLFVLKSLLILSIVYLIVRFGGKKLQVPLNIIGDIFLAIVNYIANKIHDTVEFITVFYEENCPAIHIVSPETESVD